jgi:hypothetical protein
MGLIEWFRSLFGKKEPGEIKLEPDDVTEFEKNEDVERDMSGESKAPKEEEQSEDVIVPIAPATKAKPKPKAKKKPKKGKK